MSVANDLMVARKYIAKRDNALSRGIEFNLSLQSMANLMRAKKCYYTGFALTEPRQGMPLRATDRTIDRVDATKGYVPGNVVACCHAANNLKSQCESAGVDGIKMGAQIFNRTLKRIEGGK